MSTAVRSQSVDLLKRIRADFPWFCANYIRVQNQDGDEVPFELKKAQLEFYELILRLEKRGIEYQQRVRIIILKARQLGFTTLIQAYFLWRALFFKGRSAIIVADLEEVAGEIFERKIKFMYDNLPVELQGVLDGKRKGKKLAFKKPQNSILWVEHSDNENAGRGFTFQGAHLSEFAFYRKNPKKLLTALMRAVHDRPGNIAIIESTANGMGNEFHAIWQSAELGEGHPDWNGWHAHFVPWFADADYQRPRRKTDRPLSKREKAIQRRYGLTLAQMMWRRDQVAEMGESEFDVEYPAEPRLAFAASGRPYFESELIEKHREAVVAPVRAGDFQLDSRSRKVSFHDHSLGETHIWLPPERDSTYVIGADVASGGALDNSAIHVLKLGDVYDLVASYRGKCDPDMLAVLIRRLGLVYATAGRPALAAPERNSGYGERCIQHLSDDLRYPNLFLRRSLDTVDYRESRQFGWHTGPNTRMAMLERLKQALRDGDLRVRCDRTLMELETLAYVPQPNGGERVEAPRNAHDDMVMSLAIAVSVADQAPRVRALSNDSFDPVISSVTGY